MSSTPSRDLAALLLRKASQDEYALVALATDPGAADDVLGFHAQQAIEKILKAVLAANSIRYRFTHDLSELIDLLRDHDVGFPASLEDARGLTRFAATMRYEDVPDERDAPLDRRWAIDRVRQVMAWATPAIEK